MVLSLILQFNILFRVTIPTILLTLNSAVVFPIDEETYLNPWRTRNNPKIIEFDSNGDIKLKEISIDHILSPFTQSIREHVTERHMNNNIIDDLVQEIRSLITSSFFASRKSDEKKKTRLKVLTRCNKIGLKCRFLTCPNIKVNCILCEVNMSKQYGNTTHCETFDTAYLTK